MNKISVLVLAAGVLGGCVSTRQFNRELDRAYKTGVIDGHKIATERFAPIQRQFDDLTKWMATWKDGLRQAEKRLK